MNGIKLLINNFIGKFGYQVIRARRAQAYAVWDFTLDDIFNFFPHWASRFEVDGRTYGGASDYTTKRISMLNEERLHELVNFEGKTVIEFGPLEGGNTILLEKLGARSITAIEGHLENFIRCCVIKNLFGLHRSTFHFDDMMNVTTEKYGKYDVAFVAGVLYHLDNPQLFLSRLSEMADEIVVSTHYADEESPSADAEIEEIQSNGFKYRGKLFNEAAGPHSGLRATSFWPFREDLLTMLKNAGYTQVEIINDLMDQDTKYKLIYLVARKDKP